MPVTPPPALAKPPASIPLRGSPPPQTTVTVLIKGSGAVVKAGDCVVVDYVGANRADGKVFDASFNHPGTGLQFSAGSPTLIPGFSRGIIGVAVGSRVLLDIPAAQGYGDQPPPGGPITAGENLVFVVDVLKIGGSG